MLAERIPAIQSALAEAGLDGWFFACFQQQRSHRARPPGPHRRGQARHPPLLLPGAPRGRAEEARPRPSSPPCWTICRASKTRLHHLAGAPRGAGEAGLRLPRLAAQYSPNNELPTVSRLDAGTAELLRAAGVELVSAADLAQRVRRHLDPGAARRAPPGQRPPPPHRPRGLRTGWPTPCGGASEIDEYAVQRFILDAFDQVAGLWAESDPIVGVNAHSADPHYQPGPGPLLADPPGGLPAHRPVGQGEGAADSVYADITWVGVCAAAPTDRAAGGLLRRGRRPRRRLGAGRAAASPTSRCAASRWTTPPAR